MHILIHKLNFFGTNVYISYDSMFKSYNIFDTHEYVFVKNNPDIISCNRLRNFRCLSIICFCLWNEKTNNILYTVQSVLGLPLSGTLNHKNVKAKDPGCNSCYSWNKSAIKDNKIIRLISSCKFLFLVIYWYIVAYLFYQFFVINTHSCY